MKMNFNFSGHAGPDCFMVFSPATGKLGIISCLDKEATLAAWGITRRIGYKSRSGQTQEGCLRSETSLLTPVGHWRGDVARVGEFLTWGTHPLLPGWEISVEVENHPTDISPGAMGPRIVFRRPAEDDGRRGHQVVIGHLADVETPQGLLEWLEGQPSTIHHIGPDALGRVWLVDFAHPRGRVGIDIIWFCQEQNQAPEWGRGCSPRGERPAVLRATPLVKAGVAGWATATPAGFVTWWGETLDQSLPGWQWDPRGFHWGVAQGNQEPAVRLLAWDGQQEFEVAGLKALDELWAEAQAGLAAKRTAIARQDALNAAAAADKVGKFEEVLAALPGDCQITVADSLAAGNCQAGTDRFRAEFSLGEAVSLSELRAHPRWAEMIQNEAFLRTLVLKAADINAAK